MRTALDAGKLSLGSFSFADWGSETFWVIFVYGVFLNLQNFGIDQSYTQRYVAAKSDREAVKSMFSGAMLYVPVSAVFVAIGTLLWVWVKGHPGVVPADVLAQSDAVFPWFIVHRLPHGVSGLLVAAIIAAAEYTENLYEYTPSTRVRRYSWRTTASGSRRARSRRSRRSGFCDSRRVGSVSSPSALRSR